VSEDVLEDRALALEADRVDVCDIVADYAEGLILGL
jgi:hypothetical protein